MTEIIITADLNQDDWRALQRIAQQRVRTNGTDAWRSWLVYALCCVVAVATIGLLHLHFSLASFIGGLLVAWLTFWFAQRHAVRAHAPHQNGIFLGNCTFILNNLGVESLRDRSGTRVGWKHVVDVTATDTHVFIWLDTLSAFCIPARYLPMHVVDLMTHIEQWRTQSDDTRPRGPKDETAALNPLITPGSPWRTLRFWWQLRRAPDPSLTFQVGPVVILVLISLGLFAVSDWLRAGTGAEFYAFYLPVLAVHTLFVLGLATLLTTSSSRRLPYMHVLFVLCGALPLLSLACLALVRVENPTWMMAGMAAAAVYAACYVLRALSQLVGRTPWVAAGGALGLTLLYGVMMSGSSWETRFWFPPDEDIASSDDATDSGDSVDSTSWLRGEALLFAQPAKLDAALSKVSRSANHAPQTFFVGFAGVAEQKVFAEEIKLASKVVTARYHAEQLQLVNDRRDLDTAPLATVTNLHYALQGIASRMNRDQDVLFLALSSHGSAEPRLQVSNGVLPLQPLTGAALKQALDDAGIQWRVLVISACHAGAFIKPLMNPRTIILTAAAADKTSFGCSDDRDLTYFGEAFYRDALPKAASLQDAFEKAKAIIAAREQQEGVKPSDPQAYFGSEIAARLQH